MCQIEGESISPRLRYHGNPVVGGKCYDRSMSTERPRRKSLPHAIPAWVPDGSLWFVTINARVRGLNSLAKNDVYAAVRAAFAHHENLHRCRLVLLVVMPDHLHCLLHVSREFGLTRLVTELKSYLARTRGVVWQRNFFDHRLRDPWQQFETADYLRMNPVRAGLVVHSWEWPYVYPAEAKARRPTGDP